MKALKNIQKLFSFILIATILGSCASTNDVVSNGIFQKRKYKSGYNVSIKKKTENKVNATTAEEQNLAKVEEIKLQNTNNEVKANCVESKNTTTDVVFTESNVTKEESITSFDSEQNNSEKPKEVKPVLTFKNTSSNIATNNKTSRKNSPTPKPQDDSMLIIGLIIALFLPPLGVYLAIGGGSEFRLDLILFIAGIILYGIGWGVFFIPFVWYIGYLLLFASWLYAIYVILMELL